MTIRAGDEWGRPVSRPTGLRSVDDDAALVAALTDGSESPTAIAGGDIARTLGSPSPETRDEIIEYTVDLMRVVLDDGIEHIAISHVVARSPWWTGSWWHGPVLAVMNAEFLGKWDVAPRGHPNDGRVETLRCASGFPIRQRIAVARRLSSGTHLPHPGIATRSVQHADWTFERRLTVFVDGLDVGRSHRVEVTTLPDAANIFR